MNSGELGVGAGRHARTDMLQQLWPGFRKEEFQENQWLRFFRYLDFEFAKLRSRNDLFSIADNQEALALVRTLRLYKHAPKQDIYPTLTIAAHDDSKGIKNRETAARSLELVVRLWLTISIDSFKLDPSAIYLRANKLVWPDSESLTTILTSHFTVVEGISQQRSRKVRIRSDLTMVYLEARHGFQILWTHNLADHLTIDWKYRTITVYEHLICLWSHLEFDSDPVIPRAILEEAIDTINLLFPSEKKEVQEFLNKHGRPFWELGYCKRTRVVELDKYSYWRSNVADLVDIVEEPATGFQQFLLDNDRRNLLEFATFWIAVIVGFLTVLSIVFGTVATVYSVKQYNIAAEAYALQLAQACSTPSISLSQFCS